MAELREGVFGVVKFLSCHIQLQTVTFTAVVAVLAMLHQVIWKGSGGMCGNSKQIEEVLF